MRQVSYVPGESCCAYAVLFDPGVTRGPGPTAHGRGPCTQARTRAHHIADFEAPSHGLSTRCLRLVVQGHPSPTQDSLPAAGQLYRTGLATRRIPSKGFRYASLHNFLLSQVLRNARLAPTEATFMWRCPSRHAVNSLKRLTRLDSKAARPPCARGSCSF